MEINHINPKNDHSFNVNSNHNERSNSDVLSDADREILQLVSETYLRIQGGQVKTRRQAS